MIDLQYNHYACPDSPNQLRALNRVVVSLAPKNFNVSMFEIAAECTRMFGVSDVSEAVATRKDRSVTRYATNINL